MKRLLKFLRGLIHKEPPAPKLCPCGKPSTKGYITKGKSGETVEVEECEDCFKKRIRKMTLKALKDTIHARGLDICPACGLRGKHAPLSVKHCLKQYTCANGHSWTLEGENKA